MSWDNVGRNRGPQAFEAQAPAEPAATLPMEMTSAEALEAWFAEWMRATDAEGRSGSTLHLGAFRARHERLVESERTGIPAVPVTLPRESVAARPSHFVHVMREGRHLDIAERAALTRSVFENRARRRKRNL